MTDSINRIKIIQNVVSGLYSTTIPEKVQPIPNNVRDKVGCVAIGSDHGGFEAKEIIRDYLRSIGYRVTDVGTFSKDSVDYPDFALKVAKKVASGECERGIMIDGAGIGSSMVCNKVKGIRAALCYNPKTTFAGGRHWKRVNKIMAVERNQ